MNIHDTKTCWKIAFAAALSMAMTFIDQTAVNVALPSIQDQLQISPNYLHWIINAYLLTLAMFLILGGKLGDRYSKKNIFILGVALFALASLSCALSPNGLMLVISRAVQGIGGALMLPNGTAIVISIFPDNKRGKVMGTLLSFTSIFLILGPLLGGVLSQYLSWRYVFWINLPISIISITIMSKYATTSTNNKKDKIDWLGFSLATTGLFALIFGLMESIKYDWRSLIIILPLCVAIILFALLIQYERKHKNPFIDLKVFRNKMFRYAVFLYAGIQMVFIINIFSTIYTQRVLGFSPSLAGLLAIPSLLPILFLSRYAGKLRDIHGPRLPMVIGFSLLTFGNLWLSLSFWTYNICFIILGRLFFFSAAPFIFGNANATALSAVQEKIRGVASGISACSRQLGGTISMAILGTIIVSITDSSAHHFLRNHLSLASVIHPSTILGYLNGNTKVIQTLQHWPPSLKMEVLQASEHAYMIAITIASAITTLFSALCLFVATKLPSHIEKSKSRLAEEVTNQEQNGVKSVSL